MGFGVIPIPHKVGVHRFGVCLYVALIGHKIVNHAPTDILVSVANSRKCHGHDIHNLNILIEKVISKIHAGVIVQHRVIKLCIVRTHNRAGVVTLRDSVKIGCDIRKRLNIDTMKDNRVTVKSRLVMHEAIAANKRGTKRRVRNLRHKRVVTLQNVTLSVTNQPRDIERESRVGDSLNVKNSKNLTHGRTPLVPEGEAFSPPDI